MNLEKRPTAPHPYNQALPELPAFVLKSADINEDQPMNKNNTGEGENISPQLSWQNTPQGTQSFVISCFDPDAPTPSGYWHWTIVNLPASCNELPAGAGADDATLQKLTASKAFHIRNDSGNFKYDGPYPPAGDRAHRYVFAIHALPEPTLDLEQESATNATVHFMSLFKALGRGVLTAAYQR